MAETMTAPKTRNQKSLEFSLTSIVREAVNAPSAIARLTQGVIVVDAGSVNLSLAQKAKVEEAVDNWFIGCGLTDLHRIVFDPAA